MMTEIEKQRNETTQEKVLQPSLLANLNNQQTNQPTIRIYPKSSPLAHGTGPFICVFI